MEEYPTTTVPKIQVADDLLICAMCAGSGPSALVDQGGPYVYVTSEAERFEGSILRIVDVSDPRNPKEVGDWWAPHQFVDGYPGRTVDHGALHVPEFMDKGWLHGPAFRRDDGITFCGYCGDGLYVLDLTMARNC